MHSFGNYFLFLAEIPLIDFTETYLRVLPESTWILIEILPTFRIPSEIIPGYLEFILHPLVIPSRNFLRNFSWDLFRNSFSRTLEIQNIFHLLLLKLHLFNFRNSFYYYFRNPPGTPSRIFSKISSRISIGIQMGIPARMSARISSEIHQKNSVEIRLEMLRFNLHRFQPEFL